MSSTDKALSLLTALEDHLVREFRAYQSLILLAREERTALASGDVPNLASLVEKKDILIDELMSLEDRRKSTVISWGGAAGCAKRDPTIADIVDAVDVHTSSRFKHLREGILALVDELHDLNRGNQALVLAALDRVDAMRTFLVDVRSAPLTYEPPQAAVAMQTQPSCGLEQWA